MPCQGFTNSKIQNQLNIFFFVLFFSWYNLDSVKKFLKQAKMFFNTFKLHKELKTFWYTTKCIKIQRNVLQMCQKGSTFYLWDIKNEYIIYLILNRRLLFLYAYKHYIIYNYSNYNLAHILHFSNLHLAAPYAHTHIQAVISFFLSFY